MTEPQSGYRPGLRMWVIGTESFLGPGTAELLGAVQTCGSVSAACTQMQVSYSKGRKILGVLEKELGYPVVECSKGGTGGGNARVTPAGQRLLEAYTRYEQMVRDYADSQFDLLRQALEGR